MTKRMRSPDEQSVFLALEQPPRPSLLPLRAIECACLRMRRTAAPTVTVILLIAFSTIVSAAQADSAVGRIIRLTLEPRSERLVAIDLNQGDIFTVCFNISGGVDNDINFWVADPTENTFLDLGRINREGQASFQADQSGEYTLHFDNSFSLRSSKIVTLTYYIERLMMPCIQPNLPDPFLISLGVNVLLLIAVVVLAVALAMSRQRPVHRSMEAAI